MKTIDIQKKTDKELQDFLLQLHRKLFNMRFQKASGELTNFSEFRKTRRTIARIKTHLNTVKASSIAAMQVKERSNA